jgi:hypothetical protein
MGLPKPLKHLNHLTFLNEVEDLKLSREMRLKRKGRNGIPPTHITSRALSEMLQQPHKP